MLPAASTQLTRLIELGRVIVSALVAMADQQRVVETGDVDSGDALRL